MKKTLVLATVIALLAGIWTIVVMNIKSFGDVPFVLWPTFIAWGAFFYAGATVDGLVKGLVQFATGIVVAAVASFIYVNAAFSDANFVILGVFVFVLAWPITALSGVNGFWAAVPAGFMGAAVFFGIYFFGNSGVAAGGASASAPLSAIAALIPLVCGEVLGWVSFKATGVLAADKPASSATLARPA
jgi:hypothetical protein